MTMNKTTLEAFRKELLQTGGYDSAPERCAAKRAKKGWLTTLSYTWRV